MLEKNIRYKHNKYDLEAVEMTKPERLYSKHYNSFAVWNGSAWNDENVSGAYFYSLEKAANNGYYPEIITESK